MLLGLFGACTEKWHMEEKKYSRVVGGKSSVFPDYCIQVVTYGMLVC